MLRKKSVFFLFAVFLFAFFSFVAGIGFHKYKPASYGFIKGKLAVVFPKFKDKAWAIGIYTGDTPFSLSDPLDVDNPVITYRDITDIDARFVADPFMLFDQKTWFMFFEILNKKDNKGVIGLATSKDGKKWDYDSVVLEEKFHLSYPYVFRHNGEYYMIPETSNDSSVRLYKATSFPLKWVLEKKIMNGVRFVDTSVVYHNDRWWMFACPWEGILNLYSAEILTGKWVLHPQSPIVDNDKNIARPGGRVFLYNEKLYRIAMDVVPTYGNKLRAFEIIALSENEYLEVPANDLRIGASGNGWNGIAMHNLDPVQAEGEWIGSVDGK